MISLLITLEIHPDRVDEFIRYITEEAEDARTKEPGCRGFRVSRSLEKANTFTLAKFYDHPSALEAHCQTPHFLLFKERAADGLILNKTAVCGEVIDG